MSDDSAATDRPAREVSSVAFPYYDLSDSIEIARAMLGAGGVPLDRDQLGAALNLSPSGGNFSVKVSAARMFGLLQANQGRFELTELGFEILEPSREKAAKAKAFLSVELYRRTYETFKGRQLPPRPAGLETAFVQMGVSPKQRDKARQVFDRSARTAGFFPNGADDRLVAPVIVSAPPQNSGADHEAEAVTSASTVAAPAIPALFAAATPLRHPFIEGLLATMPEIGSDWSASDRAKWLQAAAQIFDLIYKGASGSIIVTAPKDHD